MHEIYTHNEAANLIEVFEDTLIADGIRVPSPDDDDREADDLGLYGATYSDLLDEIEDALIGLLNPGHIPEKDEVLNGILKAFSEIDAEHTDDNVRILVLATLDYLIGKAKDGADIVSYEFEGRKAT